MSTWALCFWCILPLISIGMIEYVHQTSLRDRGLFRKGPQYETRELVSSFVPEFLSNFILIFSGLFFLELDYAVKKMEPFYHMSQPDGATGSTSLCVDYFRPSIFFIPYIAIRNRHWTILCTSMALILDTIVLLQLVSRSFGYDDENKMRMVPVYKYALQGVLLFASVLMGILATILHKRKSGVLRNLNDFGSLIRLTRNYSPQNSIYHVFEELDIDEEICEEELERKLGPLRFKLQAQYLGDEEPQFSIVHLPPLDKEASTQPTIAPEKFGFFLTFSWIKTPRWVSKATRLRRRWLWKDNHPWLFQKIPLCVISFILIVLFIILTGQPFWARNGGFPKTFGNSWHSVLKFIFTVSTSSFWVQIWRYSSEYEYIYLMRREQGAPYAYGNSIAFIMWPFQDLWLAARDIYRNGYGDASSYVDLNSGLAVYASQIYLFAWLALPDETYDSWTTTIVCVSIMIPCEVIMISEILLLLYCRSRPFLPRQPITLASKLLMVYATDIIKAGSNPNATTKPLGQHQKASDLEGAETPQASKAVNQLPPSFQGSLNPSDNSETTIQEIFSTNIPATPPTPPPNPATSPMTANNSPQTSRRWWDILSRKGKSKGKSKRKRRLRTWSDFVEDGADPRDYACALGKFTGRDGKPHMGIGKHDGPDMTTYTLSKDRQDKIDEGCTYETKPTRGAEMV
jgi:hypothetical protein